MQAGNSRSYGAQKLQSLPGLESEQSLFEGRIRLSDEEFTHAMEEIEMSQPAPLVSPLPSSFGYTFPLNFVSTPPPRAPPAPVINYWSDTMQQNIPVHVNMLPPVPVPITPPQQRSLVTPYIRQQAQQIPEGTTKRTKDWRISPPGDYKNLSQIKAFWNCLLMNSFSRADFVDLKDNDDFGKLAINNNWRVVRSTSPTQDKANIRMLSVFNSTHTLYKVLDITPLCRSQYFKQSCRAHKVIAWLDPVTQVLCFFLVGKSVDCESVRRNFNDYVIKAIFPDTTYTEFLHYGGVYVGEGMVYFPTMTHIPVPGSLKAKPIDATVVDAVADDLQPDLSMTLTDPVMMQSARRSQNTVNRHPTLDREDRKVKPKDSPDARRKRRTEECTPKSKGLAIDIPYRIVRRADLNFERETDDYVARSLNDKGQKVIMTLRVDCEKYDWDRKKSITLKHFVDLMFNHMPSRGYRIENYQAPNTRFGRSTLEMLMHLCCGIKVSRNKSRAAVRFRKIDYSITPKMLLSTDFEPFILYGGMMKKTCFWNFATQQYCNYRGEIVAKKNYHKYTYMLTKNNKLTTGILFQDVEDVVYAQVKNGDHFTIFQSCANFFSNLLSRVKRYIAWQGAKKVGKVVIDTASDAYQWIKTEIEKLKKLLMDALQSVVDSVRGMCNFISAAASAFYQALRKCGKTIADYAMYFFSSVFGAQDVKVIDPNTIPDDEIEMKEMKSEEELSDSSVVDMSMFNEPVYQQFGGGDIAGVCGFGISLAASIAGLTSTADPKKVMEFFRGISIINSGTKITVEVFERIADATYYYVTGDFLYESSRLSERIKKCSTELDECFIILDNRKQDDPIPTATMEKLVRLQKELRTLALDFAKVPAKAEGRNAIGLMISAAQEQLRKAVLVMAQAGNRIKPTSIVIHGPPGGGKSDVARALPVHTLQRLDELCEESNVVNPYKHVDPDKSTVTYQCFAKREYYENYGNQFAVQMEELYTSQDVEVNVEWSAFFQVASDDKPFDLNMAFGGKGCTFFTSAMLIATTNDENHVIVSKSETAYYRRIDVDVHMESVYKEGTTHPLTHSTFITTSAHAKVIDVKRYGVEPVAHHDARGELVHRDPRKPFNYYDLVNHCAHLLYKRIFTTKETQKVFSLNDLRVGCSKVTPMPMEHAIKTEERKAMSRYAPEFTPKRRRDRRGRAMHVEVAGPDDTSPIYDEKGKLIEEDEGTNGHEAEGMTHEEIKQEYAEVYSTATEKLSIPPMLGPDKMAYVLNIDAPEFSPTTTTTTLSLAPVDVADPTRKQGGSWTDIITSEDLQEGGGRHPAISDDKGTLFDRLARWWYDTTDDGNFGTMHLKAANDFTGAFSRSGNIWTSPRADADPNWYNRGDEDDQMFPMSYSRLKFPIFQQDYFHWDLDDWYMTHEHVPFSTALPPGDGEDGNRDFLYWSSQPKHRNALCYLNCLPRHVKEELFSLPLKDSMQVEELFQFLFGNRLYIDKCESNVHFLVKRLDQERRLTKRDEGTTACYDMFIDSFLRMTKKFPEPTRNWLFNNILSIVYKIFTECCTNRPPTALLLDNYEYVTQTWKWRKESLSLKSGVHANAVAGDACYSLFKSGLVFVAVVSVIAAVATVAKILFRKVYTVTAQSAAKNEPNNRPPKAHKLTNAKRRYEVAQKQPKGAKGGPVYKQVKIDEVTGYPVWAQGLINDGAMRAAGNSMYALYDNDSRGVEHFRAWMFQVSGHICVLNAHVWDALDERFIACQATGAFKQVRIVKSQCMIVYRPYGRDIVYVQMMQLGLGKNMFANGHILTREQAKGYVSPNSLLRIAPEWTGEASWSNDWEVSGRATHCTTPQIRLSQNGEAEQIEGFYVIPDPNNDFGFCGKVYACHFKGKTVFPCIHGGGNTTSCFGDALYQEDYDEILKNMIPQVMQFAQVGIGAPEPNGAYDEGPQDDISVKINKNPVGKSCFIKTPFHEQDEVPCPKHPAVLSREAYANGIAKEAAMKDCINPDPYVIDLIQTEHVNLMSGFLRGELPSEVYTCDILTPEEGLYGNDQGVDKFDFSTADGQRLQAAGRSRADLADPKSETTKWTIAYVQLLLYWFSLGKFTYQLNSNCLKDELRDPERVALKKTRIFNVTDFIDCLLQKMILGSFVAKMKQYFFTNPMACGITPGRRHWKQIYDMFKDAKYGINASDVSGWDYCESFPFLYVIVPWICTFYPACNVPGSFTSQLILWAIASCLQGLRCAYGKGYVLGRGNTSGNWLTTILNTIYNYLFHVIAYYWLAEQNGVDPRTTFKVDFICELYSDDNLSVSCEYEWWTPKNVAMAFKKLYGITLTSTDKGEVTDGLLNIDDVDFLSRKFRPHEKFPGMICAPLARDSLLAQLFYVRKQKGIDVTEDFVYKQLEINIGNVIRELREYHYDEAKPIYDWICRTVAEKRLPIVVPGFDRTVSYNDTFAVYS